MKVIEKGGKLVTEPKMCFTHVHTHRNIKKWIDPINSNFKRKKVFEMDCTEINRDFNFGISYLRTV